MSATSTTTTQTLHEIKCTGVNTLTHLTSKQQQPNAVTALNRAISSLRYQARTLWLFTWSDIRTMLVPMAALGLLSAAAGSMTTLPVSGLSLLLNAPVLLLWLWLQILVLSISNQRDPAAVLEDSVNKPWRPISAGRLTSAAARRWLLLVVPLICLLGVHLNVATETFFCLAANFYYNDLGGADEHFGTRQVINGLAYPVYGVAALKIAAGVGAEGLTPEAYKWMSALGFIVGTTIQIQDLKDFEGDKLRGRSTIPVVFGDLFTRLSVCAGVLFWSAACPAYWNAPVTLTAAVLASGVFLSARILCVRDAVADRFSFIAWSWWVMGLFFLPLFGGSA